MIWFTIVNFFRAYRFYNFSKINFSPFETKFQYEKLLIMIDNLLFC